MTPAWVQEFIVEHSSFPNAVHDDRVDSTTGVQMAYLKSWAKRMRERPAHANPMNGREILGAALNRLLRLAFALVKKQDFYRLPQPEPLQLAI